MTCFSRSFRALLWRNAIYRKRRWLPSLIEFFLPALCVAILWFIKLDLQSDPNSTLNAVVVPASYPGGGDVIIPFSFHDYATAIQAARVCVDDPTATSAAKLLGLNTMTISGLDYRDWPVPFVFCNSKACRERGEDATDFCTYKTFALAPMNAVKADLQRMLSFKDYVEKRYPQLTNSSALPFKHDFLQIFDSNDALQSYVTSESYGEWRDGQYFPKVAIAVVFSGGKDSKSYEYTIRTNSTNFNSAEQSSRPAAKTTPTTQRVFSPFQREDSSSCSSRGGPRMGIYGGSCTGQYILNGAVTIQRLVDDWILSDSGANATVAENGAVFLPFPTKEYTKSGFYGSIGPFAPLLFTLGLLYPVSSTIRSVVLEKELRQKELMKMMSVTECDIGWSWFLSFYAFFAPSGILTAVFTKLLYSTSNFMWLLVFWQLTFISCIVFCFLIAAISTKATKATLIGIMLFFVGYFVPSTVDYQNGDRTLVTLMSLHPVTAYTYGLIMMGYLEDSGVGVQSTTLRSSEFPSGYTFASSLSMLLFDSILWGFVCWYLNRIVRGEYGTALKWYFPFTRQYWFPTRKVVANEPTTTIEDAHVPIEDTSESVTKQTSEDSLGVHIHGLRKQFGEKTAVSGLNLSMHHGQITALLGHNGAGKTTTIAMLTGLVPPTSGYATVAGYDIRTDLASLRENVGVCLQQDCLFPQLTVMEHVIFFSKIKGLYDKKSKEECNKAVLTAIDDVALSEKRQSFAKDLSGGMKRKLSVAIAFCGDPKVVFLDEPTSGMDPFARRFTWNVIRKYRENRVIVLTTHFMDEADLLGDRIAIMAEGQLRCVGSSLFLKRKFGVGYQLTIIKNSNVGEEAVEKEEEPLTQEEESKEDECCVGMDLNGVLDGIVKGAVPSASVLSNVGTEMKFQLPIGESARFVGMFKMLDKQIKKHRIETYGVSVTTLDEVFLLVARGDAGPRTSSETNKVTTANKEMSEVGPRSILNDPLSTVGECNRFNRHVQALFSKRAKNFKRDKKAWCCSTILPTIIPLLGFLVVNFTGRRSPNFPSLALSLDQNNPGIVLQRNPIPFNKPGEYECQPGKCVYGRYFVSDATEGIPASSVSTKSELYHFCGTNARVGSAVKDGNKTINKCTIRDSLSIINQTNQWGAFGVETAVSEVPSTSKSVHNMSDDFGASLYGGIFFTHEEGSITTNGTSFDDLVVDSCLTKPGSYRTAEQCANFGGIGYIVNYNFTSLHSSLLYQATADEALMRKYTNSTDYKISVSVWPLPITSAEKQYTLASNSFAAWFLLVLSFPFIAGSFATFIVDERERKARHLQTVSGVKPSAYWLSTFLWDVMNYQIPLWTVIILMYRLDIQSFITSDRQAASTTFSLLILFGPAAAGFTYIVCFFFKSPSMANLFVIVFNFFIGMAGPLICFILRVIAADLTNPKPNLKNAAIALEWILRLVPSFCLGKGLLYTINANFFELIEQKTLDTWSPAIALYEVIFLGIESVAFVALTILIDILSGKPSTAILLKKMTDFLTFRWLFMDKTVDATHVHSAKDDDDVIVENERVRSGKANEDLVVLNALSKQYPNGKQAVDFMSLGIPAGQCFGLLGINGAGKTTCMAMLTAEFPPSSGDAILDGFSVSNEPDQTRRTIGYCPQFDAHFANMTGAEHVELYAVIKGVRRDLLKEVVSAKLNEVGLSEFDGNRLSSTYSGGMKRKLSVAIATIGAPRIVFLDEPSTGMDPVARRDLWKVISTMVQGRSDMAESKTSVILTTHSMEECEALCPRIGIMAGGRLRCLGSAQHLKSRFGEGYQIEMKVKHPLDQDVDVLEATRLILGNSNNNGLGTDLEAVDLHKMAADTSLDLDQAKAMCIKLTGDDSLSKMINPDNPNGYSIFKVASSPVGVCVAELVGFCAEELRVKALVDFFEGSYNSAILRERQGVKLRYEIASKGVTISSVFANIEEHKEKLKVDEYGVSQTSLEQVFNTFAAVAEIEKKNTVDGKLDKLAFVRRFLRIASPPRIAAAK